MRANPGDQTLLLNDPLPRFQLLDSFGKSFDIRNYYGAPALLIAFFNNSSPPCRRLHQKLAELASEYRRRGLGIVGVNPSAASGTADEGATAMSATTREAKIMFPYLMDSDQNVARQFGLLRVPDFFVFNAQMRLVYHGRFDGTDQIRDEPPTGADLREALDRVLRGEQTPPGIPSMGDPFQWIPRPQVAP